jgi:hypothetical protein
MVKISQVGPEARGRVIPKGPGSKAYQLRTPIREAIAALGPEDTLEFEPDAGETLRQLKVMTRRAGKEAGKEIQYGESEQGSLLVWLGESTQRRRRRGRTAEPEPENLAAQVM